MRLDSPYRPGDLVVAASNAPDSWKRVAVGGASGTADQNTVNSLVSQIAATSAGAGPLVFSPGSFYFNDLAAFQTGIPFKLNAGTQLRWAGSAGGTLLSTPTTVPTLRSGVLADRGAQIFPGNAGYVFDLHSVQWCEIAHIEFRMEYAPVGASTLIICRVRCDADTTTGGYRDQKDSALNNFHDWKGTGRNGTVLDLQGISGESVTDNQFGYLDFDAVERYIVNLGAWADNNVFPGYVRGALRYDNAVGVIVNSVDPANEQNVYANRFHDLIVDTFAGNTGRIAMVLNNSKQTEVGRLFQVPEAEGGVVQDNYSFSHDIKQVGKAGTVAIQHIRKQVTAVGRSVQSLTDAATVTPSWLYEGGHLVTLAQDTTIANPTETPGEDQTYLLRVKSTTARALSWGTQFRASTSVALPASTSGGSKTDRIAWQWNAADSKCDIVYVSVGY